MESLGSDDVFSESWQNCALVKREIKVEKLIDEQVEVTKENPMLSCKNTNFNEANVMSSIKKKKLQPELVVYIERLPSIFKAEMDITVEKLNDSSSEDEDTEYLIEESQNEVNFSLKRQVKTRRSITGSEEEELLTTFKNSKSNKQTIKEDFVESKTIIQEELDIKDEDEGEDQFTAKSTISQIEKRHNPSNIPAHFNWISTNKRFYLTNPSIFKCLNCTYQTHRKVNIARHVLIHMKKTLECSHCSYKTRHNWVFRQHKLVHVPKEQVKDLHRCPECSYTSIWKSNLTRHTIKHEKPDNVTWYQCPECPYKTKHRRSLRRQHMLIHKKDLPMHKCTLCCYETSQKSTLTKHIRIKHRPKDIQPVHCQKEGCSFKTHHESYLARHIRVMHECKIYFKCSTCSFQTLHRSSFNAHERGHGDREKWFSCTLCSYKTPRASNLKAHMVMHKSGNEINWFQCSECHFKTKHERSLRGHKLTHNPNPQKIFKCSECSYKTVYARTLQLHGLVHKKPEEISEWFYCYLCTSKTSIKCNLVAHIQRKHRDSNGRINDS